VKHAKFTPRIAETARGFRMVYRGFSRACPLSYRVAGMDWPNAFMHLCAAMGVGATHRTMRIFAHRNAPPTEGVAVMFMAQGGCT
jgi:trk system potassium uptake protein TrkH